MPTQQPTYTHAYNASGQGQGQPGPEAFNRPPRILTAPPQGTVNVPVPPAKEALPAMPALLSLLLPIITMLILFSVYLLVNHGSMQQLVFLLPMAIFSVMTPVTTLLTARQRIKAVKRKWQESDKSYRDVLARLHTQLTEQAEEQRQVALLSDPTPAELEERIKERTRLWERRPADPDFLTVRVGTGRRPFSITVQVPDCDPTEPLSANVQALKENFFTVDDMPCSVPLTKLKSLGITGRRQDVAALTRDMLCQIATHHSPEDVRILGLFPVSQKHDWEWVGELPHTRPLKGQKEERLVAIGQDEANQLLNALLEELSQRASNAKEENAAATANGSTPTSALPHIVVLVHDYVEVRKHPALTHAFKLGEQLGVSVIYMVAQQQSIPSECHGVLRISDEGRASYAAIGVGGETLNDVSADVMELGLASRIAHALSPIEVAQEGEDVVDLPTNVRFLDLVNLPYADQLDVEQWWSQPRFGRLRVPIGMGVNGPVWLDLNDNAHGPHGIIAGTTGAGKSELLQSLIVGLAMTHHPHLVNFVLVDFKGGAAFKPFEKLPHTVGMVTDLSGRLTERALTALKSELRRREHVLSQANVKKIAEYQAMRALNPTMEPLPNLLIIIDEFAELAKEHPTFMDGLVSVVQKGRSLGVHLILATQKPTGSVNPNIWSNLKFRICLRVASLQDSRDMLGRSEAALLPSTIPGRAYFQIGSEIFEQFQSARISLPARVANEKALAAKQAELGIGAGEIVDQKVIVDALEPYQETIGAELFHPWPGPLPHKISLPEVYRQAGKGQYAAEWGRSSSTTNSTPPYGWLTCPMGLVDLPMEQKQEPWLLDMPHQGGHVLVSGASGTGKSVFLRTLITSLVQTHAPNQLHLYLVDFGGQALRVFDKLPHVGGVFSETDDEHIRRLLRKLQGIIDERRQYCMAHQIDDFLAYQRRRSENSPTDTGTSGGALPEMPAIVMVIDKFPEFRQAHEKEMDLLLSIARHGRTYGVYLVLSIDRPVAMPTQLMSLIEIRIGLRLVELTDSLILLGKHDAAHIDPALLGRGYKRGKTLEEVQIALPMAGEDDDEQTSQLDELVNAIARAVSTGGAGKNMQKAPAIRLLPEYVRTDYFLMDAVSSYKDAMTVGAVRAPSATQHLRPYGTSSQAPTISAPANALRIRLGIEDFSLRPIALELNADTPHLLVGGGPGSGRTGVLQTSLLMLAGTLVNKEARVILVDFRRSSRLLRRLPNVWKYADTEESLFEAIESLKVELKERMQRLRAALEHEDKAGDGDALANLQMQPIVLMIDDYDQLSILNRNPLNDLREFLLQARDLRLHIIIAGAPADLVKTDALLQQVRACRFGIVLGGDPADPALLGVRISDLPPGRGHVVRRNQRHLVQVAHLAPPAIQS